MGYIAYNNAKRAYLAMDECKRWGFTNYIGKAYFCVEHDRMVGIIKAQSKIAPDDWRIVEVENDPQKVQTAFSNPEQKKDVVYDSFNPVRGEWEMTEEYRLVLTSIESIKKYTNPNYAAELRKELDECNNEIMDLEHYIEITSITASNVWWVCKRMKDVRIRRRNIQQQIQLINRLNECRTVDEMLDGRFESPNDTVSKCYVPRSKYGETMPWESKDKE